MIENQNKRIPLPVRVIVQILFILESFTIIFAIYYLVSNGLKTDKEFAHSAILPGSVNPGNFIRVWVGGGVGQAFRNSLFYAFAAVAVDILLGSLAAFSFDVFKFKFKKLIFRVIISTMYMAPMTLIIPLYLQMISLKLNNRVLGIIIIYSGTSLAFAIFMLTTFFRGIPRELVEAAAIDGAGGPYILFRIFIPLSKAAIATLVIMIFSAVWNDLLYGLIFLQKSGLKTIMLVIAGFKGGRYISRYTDIFTSLTILVIPIIVMYSFAQKYFVGGVTMGSVK